MIEKNEKLIEKVAADFASGLHCSQVTFGHAAEKLGFDEKTAKKIGAGFGGGMFNGERCGAVTGALMGLGLKYGHSCAEDKPNEAEMQAKRVQLEKAFLEKYDSLLCKDILGANIGTPEGLAEIKEKNLTSGCAELTAYVCQILDELL